MAWFHKLCTEKENSTPSRPTWRRYYAFLPVRVTSILEPVISTDCMSAKPSAWYDTVYPSMGPSRCSVGTAYNGETQMTYVRKLVLSMHKPQLTLYAWKGVYVRLISLWAYNHCGIEVHDMIMNFLFSHSIETIWCEQFFGDINKLCFGFDLSCSHPKSFLIDSCFLFRMKR